MNKSQKEKINNMFYNQPLDIKENEQIKQNKKKAKEREKRIKKANKNKNKEQEKFDLDTETVIGMTTKNSKRKKQVIQKQIQEQQRKKTKKRKKLLKIIKWTSIIALFIGGIIFTLVSPIFNIQQVTATGNEIVSSDTIISLSGLGKDQNIFKFINQQIESKIKEEPYIEKAKIKRILPNKVEIQVQERKKAYNIEFMNKYAYIDNQGNILQIAEEKQDLPTIKGIQTAEENIVAGNRLEKEDLEKLETVIQIITIWQTNNAEQKITNIDITNKTEYTLYIEQEAKTIHLGDESNLNNKILWAQAIINDNKGIEGDVYVNGDLNDKFKPRFKQKV